MIVHTLNPVLLDLGPLQIRYYSIFYIIGLIVSFFIINYLSKKKKLRLSRDDVVDYIVYLAIGLLVGGRILYFVFYDFSALFRDPVELFRLWHGGMSFHGGLVGTLVAGIIFCKRKKVDFWQMADITVVPLGIALALGRLGNFVNGELYGRPWDGFFCVDYTQNPHLNFLPEMCRYPSQLAEAAKNIVIFSVIWTIKDKRLPKGFLFWSFVTMYGVLRFSIEVIREPDSQLGFYLGYFTMGQILCSFMILVGGFMLFYLKRKKYK